MYEEIMRRHRPHGWKVIHRNYVSKTAIALSIHDAKGKRIICPQVVDRETLYLYLHECGHVHLGHFKLDLETPREEYEAERWAINTMRSEGIPVPRECLRKAKLRVQSHIINAGSAEAHVCKWSERC